MPSSADSTPPRFLAVARDGNVRATGDATHGRSNVGPEADTRCPRSWSARACRGRVAAVKSAASSSTTTRVPARSASC